MLFLGGRNVLVEGRQGVVDLEGRECGGEERLGGGEGRETAVRV